MVSRAPQCKGGPVRVLIAGSSGFLGSHLVDRLRGENHEVVRLVRRAAGAGERRWDPYAGPLGPDVLDGVDAVVNLAGSPTLGNPHSRRWRTELRHSRVTTTRVLADAVARARGRVSFLAGNAIAWYGDHGDEPLPESADSRADTFLGAVTRDWEAATLPARDSGARVVVLRTVPVLDRRSAPLRQLHLLYRLGLGGRVGSGRQYFPMVSLRDWVGAVVHLLGSDVAGPVNVCAPQTPTYAEFNHALAAAVRRPAFLPVPAPLVRVAAGPMAPEVLGSVRAVPQRLLDDGYAFADHDVTAVLRTGLSAD
jgi:uncharacterized protein (TIGR01777 family)